MKRNLSYVVMLLFLLLTAGFTQCLTRASDRDRAPKREPLVQLPQQIASWRQTDVQALSGGTLRELKADDYLSSIYSNDHGAFAYLFIAYYASQRHRQTIHSPQNCMPGGGWTMSNYQRHQLDGQGSINEYLIEKDGIKMLAFYWYHGRGRMVASEYWARAATIKDAMWLGRTDGALVRVIVPMGNADDAEDLARAAGLDLVQTLLPVLPKYVPD
jgi:EpsI family protein